MAIERSKVTVETGRIDSEIMPLNFPYPLKEYLVNSFQDLNAIADKSNEAGEDAQEAVNTNARQDADIKENSALIAKNESAIATNKATIESHVSSDSQHGVKGNNIGSEDFCTLTIGGVSLLAANVPSIPLVFPNSIESAPDEYSQSYTQKLTDAINSTVTNQKIINTQIDALIIALIDAKVMSESS